MRCLFVSLLFFVAAAIGCKERKIVVGDADPATDSLSILVKGIKEDPLLEWAAKDVELHCQSITSQAADSSTASQISQSQTTVFRASSLQKQSFDYLMSFSDPKISEVNSCFLQIRVSSDSYKDIDWSASKNEPGLLYVTRQIAITEKNLELQAIKTYESASIKVIDSNCFTATQANQSCLDRRRVIIERPKLPWYAIVSGYEQGSGGSSLLEKTYIVTAKKPLGVSSGISRIDAEELFAELSSSLTSSHRFAWFDFLSNEKALLAMTHEQIVFNKFENNAVQVTSNFKPLHIQGLFSFGFGRVTEEYLNRFNQAVWYSSIAAESEEDAHRLLVGGKGSLFFSPQRPNADSFIDTEDLFMSLAEKKGFYRTFISTKFSVSGSSESLDPCMVEITSFLNLSKFNLVKENSFDKLRFCNPDPGYFSDAAKKQWSFTIEHYLEDWHEQKL